MRANRMKGADALYSGKSEKEAMEAAGLVYSPANARRFRNSLDIRERMRALFEGDRQFLLLDALRAKREREHIAYARISNYFEDVLDGEGKPTGERRFKGFGSLSDCEVAAIKSIKETKLGTVIELFEKDAALRAIEARVDPVVRPDMSDERDDRANSADQVASWNEPATAARH